MKQTLRTIAICVFLLFFFIKSNAQRTVTYKAFLIQKSTDKKRWDKVPFTNCLIVQDLDKLTITVYNGTAKLVYVGYDVEIPEEDPKIGTTYISKCIDKDGKECIIQQIIWNGDLKGSSTFYINYAGLSLSYNTDIINHSNN